MLVSICTLTYIRKYNRGSRVRKGEVQWGLTIVEVDPTTGKTLSIDLQMLPYNKRDAETMLPLIEQRMEEGAIIITDYWKAYGVIANNLGLEHHTVNHSKEFENVDCWHTNNVEGKELQAIYTTYNTLLEVMHKVLKTDARVMFGRLPYLSRKRERNIWIF